MVRFGTATSVEEEMRAPCWDLLNWIVTHKSKSCVKKGLVAPVVQAAAQCMYVVPPRGGGVGLEGGGQTVVPPRGGGVGLKGGGIDRCAPTRWWGWP